MTLQAVNELITSLDSAGELSIKERKFLKLAKAYVVIAAENVGLKAAITDHSQSVHFCEVCGKDDPCSTDDVCYVLSETPATDRLYAGIKADGVEEFAAKLESRGRHLDYVKVAYAFAQQLREGASE
ncbi:hypothetical protein BZP36_16590 [Raoultella terrigena]|nr:hypothetical protein [Raoultella terrigena]OMP92757.1 hypothetical protein BZP36_16590 [Raoultella terrigena]